MRSYYKIYGLFIFCILLTITYSGIAEAIGSETVNVASADTTIAVCNTCGGSCDISTTNTQNNAGFGVFEGDTGSGTQEIVVFTFNQTIPRSQVSKIIIKARGGDDGTCGSVNGNPFEDTNLWNFISGSWSADVWDIPWADNGWAYGELIVCSSNPDCDQYINDPNSQFRYRIWDNDGGFLQNVDGVEVDYNVVYIEGDLAAPTTTASLSGTTGEEGWWITNVTVTLSCSDSGTAGGAPIGCDTANYPKYCIDTTNSCIPDIYYSGEFVISNEGINYLRYYSKDINGDTELTKNTTVKINKSISPDTTPPASISNLQHTTSQTQITWTWTNPPDADFSHTMVYIDGSFTTNTSNGYFTLTGLSPNTTREIATRTVDINGNINTTWVNDAATTNQALDVFWFIHVTDVHMGSGSAYTYLSNLASNVVPTVGPFFVSETGDVTEGPLLYLGSQVQSQWTDHRTVLETNNNFNASFYREQPGNHDAVGDDAVDTNDPGPSDKLTAFKTWYALVGSVFGLHNKWTNDVGFGTYTHIGIDSVDDDQGALQAPGRFMPAELTWVENELQNSADSDLVFVACHHPTNDVEAGGAEFENLLDEYNVSLYFYGHGHANIESKSRGTLIIETESFTKSSQRYRIFAVDSTADNCGIQGISTVLAQLNVWPAVIITSPLDNWIAASCYCMPQSSSVPIRALVFDVNSPSSVNYRVDSGSWVSMSNVEGNLWDASWNTCSLSIGSHTVSVQATSASGTRSDTIINNVCANRAPNLTSLPDQDLAMNSGLNDNIIDLWAHASDAEDADNLLTFIITSQTNTTVIDCSVDSNRYINCTVQEGITGSSNITVRVTDTCGLIAEDTFTIMVSCVTPTDGMVIIKDTTFCQGTYNLVEGITINASNVVLDCNDAEIVGNNSGMGIYGMGGIDVQLLMEITDNLNNPAPIIENMSGFLDWLNFTENITIKNCVISNYDTAINVTAFKNLEVYNNNLHDNIKGIGYFSNYLSNTHDNAIYNNKKGIYSVAIESSISDNTVYNNEEFGMGDGGFNCSNFNNNVYDNGAGIISIGYYYKIFNNNASGNGLQSSGLKYGIGIIGGNGTEIFSNIASNNGKGGIGMANIVDAKIYNNIVESNEQGISVGGLFQGGTSHLLNISNNTINYNSKAGIVFADATMESMLRQFMTGTVAGAGHSIVDSYITNNDLNNTGEAYDLYMADVAGAHITANTIIQNNFNGKGVYDAYAGNNVYCVGGVGNSYGVNSTVAPGDC